MCTPGAQTRACDAPGGDLPKPFVYQRVHGPCHLFASARTLPSPTSFAFYSLNVKTLFFPVSGAMSTLDWHPQLRFWHDLWYAEIQCEWHKQRRSRVLRSIRSFATDPFDWRFLILPPAGLPVQSVRHASTPNFDSHATLCRCRAVRQPAPFVNAAVRSQGSLVAENLCLRKQLAFYQERAVRPRRLTDAARLTSQRIHN